MVSERPLLVCLFEDTANGSLASLMASDDPG